jgi:3-mercaptopyruvate sulfurtransferase SseA
LAPQKKVLVSRDFLDTDHGEIECETCHGGDPEETRKEAAHQGLDSQPSVNDAEGACGECHPDIVETTAKSLHVTLATFAGAMNDRADPKARDHIETARKNHCSACHTSCGGCHVSRPAYVKKGFVNGHIFNKKPDLINQCMACHGSRIGNEFIGLRGQGDTHAHNHNMGCMACHKAEEMHAAAPAGIKVRYELKEAVQCTDCHEGLEYGSILDHAVHIGKVQCQVCHSQSYTNCYSCHVGIDKKGLSYFQNQKDVETFKIGRNTTPNPAYKYMLVRHVPADPKAYDHYAKDALTNFNRLPTWKRTSPHNIRRQTWQNANCNHCHGNRTLFLDASDLLDYEIEANKRVVVSDAQIPRKIINTQPIKIDTGRVRKDMVVDIDWLHGNINEKNMVIVDARPASVYKTGHIKGAVNIDPIVHLRWPWDSAKPQELIHPEDLGKVFGNLGLTGDDHIVVYDKDGWRAGFLASVLIYNGAEKVSFLKGGLIGWQDAGHPLTTEIPTVQPVLFKTRPHWEFIVDNEFVQKNLDNPFAVVVDARTLDQSKGVTKHPRALRAGRIPGSVKLPVASLYMDHADLKSPEELLWLLKTRRITPDKTVIVTCNTDAWAGGAFFMFRYLGYPDVRMHDAAWVSWCAQLGAGSR